MEFLLLYSLFLNPIEEFYSAWRWKVYDCQPHTQIILLTAMDAAREDISAEGWIRHSKSFHPRCIAREDICRDMDENDELKFIYKIHFVVLFVQILLRNALTGLQILRMMVREMYQSD